MRARTKSVQALSCARVLALADGIGLNHSVRDAERFVEQTNVLPLCDGSASIRVDLIIYYITT
jgi:hypothetical protein